MSVLEGSRRASFAVQQRKVADPGVTFDYNRKASLREMPSFRDEASRALNRMDDLARIKERLSASKELLTADPATKPWLRKTSGIAPLRVLGQALTPARPMTSPEVDNIMEDSSRDDIRASPSSIGPADQVLEHHRPRNPGLNFSTTTNSSEASFHSESAATGYYDFR